jgi:uncharacterized protein (AIM24 family)
MNFETIDSKQGSYGKVEVLQLPQLAGSSDARSAESLYFITQAGMRLKKVRITLPTLQSKIRVEPGALYYMHGALEMKASTGGGILRGLARKALTGETFFVNEIHGKGEIYLEPTFGHFILVELTKDELIVDKSLFYASLGDIEVSASINKAAASIAGGEGFFQTKISGTGVAVLFSPVPMSEIQEFKLNNDKLSVDGNFALMRSSGVDFTVEKSSKSWVATSVSGEGLLQTFKGTGSVWLAPTQGVYDKLATPDGLQQLAGPPGARTTNTRS